MSALGRLATNGRLDSVFGFCWIGTLGTDKSLVILPK